MLFAMAAGARTMASSTEGKLDSLAVPADAGRRIRLFLAGDVMTGRAIDQIQRHPGDPHIHEPYVRSALQYLEIAERASGPIPRAVTPDYIWGDALAAIDRAEPHARIVNLETAVTERGEPWPGKGIQYRMHPANVACLTAARIDCCVLANNHVLDWGRAGLDETLAVLRAAGLRTAGAGRDESEACAPAVIDGPHGGRVLVFGFGSHSSGVPMEWAATRDRSGVCMLSDTDERDVERVARLVQAARRPGDVVVASIHWGGNWGYEVPAEQRSLAHRLVDAAGVDVVHGHSSHHPRPIEVHRGKLILYGCGDLLNDYEGIGGYEALRPELGFIYLPDLDARDGALVRLTLVPTRIGRFRVNLATAEEQQWLLETFNRESRDFGTQLVAQPDGSVVLQQA
jgi:poly-gamma-glutamate synthesis protein (capsule biosynthesis protein)